MTLQWSEGWNADLLMVVGLGHTGYILPTFNMCTCAIATTAEHSTLSSASTRTRSTPGVQELELSCVRDSVSESDR